MNRCVNHQSCVDQALRTADRICQDRGLRFTDLRRKTLKMIWASHAPVKAYDILNKLKGSQRAAKPPTVYRTLDFLLKHRFIHRLNSLNAYIGCDHPRQTHQCYFLICRDCGEIKECCNPALADRLAAIASRNKFNPERVSLEIEGTCKQCSKKK